MIVKGAFSSIYKGYNRYTKETVAVKEISLETLNKYESHLEGNRNYEKDMSSKYS